MANTTILEAIIKEHRAKGSPMILASVDLAKAFDEVCTESIIKALYTARIDHKTIEEVATAMELSRRWSNTLDMKRGVRQGYPTSRILFYMVLDPFLQALENRYGVMIGNIKVTSLAFADDYVLLAKDVATMRGNLEVLERFLETNLMEFDVAQLLRSQLEIRGKNIPTLAQLRYLGQFYEAKVQEGSSQAVAETSGPESVFNSKAYTQVYDMYVTTKKLKNCGSLIRIFVKKMLHLLIMTPDAFFSMHQ
ncbi:hypothetical protein PR048_018896 [Dryococelus australis]|uniref:Reverse transcriptase domain-containing protein n=1 Tax=Dryococelus australis TaxID=614101 RepID=A0ABQ9H234_9NEOP|nr:hypothetical protein PR048_018896 [Dryococelus australis]